VQPTLLQEREAALDQIAEHLSLAEANLVTATPASVGESAGHVERALAALTEFHHAMRGASEPPDPDSRERCRWKLNVIDGRVRRLQALMSQAGKFYEDWGRRLREQSGYAQDGQLLTMPELARRTHTGVRWEG
jgi:hypothetical protein